MSPLIRATLSFPRNEPYTAPTLIAEGLETSATSSRWETWNSASTCGRRNRSFEKICSSPTLRKLRVSVNCSITSPTDFEFAIWSDDFRETNVAVVGADVLPGLSVPEERTTHNKTPSRTAISTSCFFFFEAASGRIVIPPQQQFPAGRFAAGIGCTQ